MIIKEKNKFPKEDLKDSYYPHELILVKENGKYRFAVNYYAQIKAVKVLHNNKDYRADDVVYADFALTDPNNLCPLSQGDSKKPFFSHFVKDISFGKPFCKGNSEASLKNLLYVIAPICDTLMSYKREYIDAEGNKKQTKQIPLKEILRFEEKINGNLFEKPKPGIER